MIFTTQIPGIAILFCFFHSGCQASAASLSLGDVILALRVCPMNDIIFCLNRGIVV